MRSHKNSLPYTVEEDTIYGVDFPKGIDEALSRRDYREAIRLLYLQTLKQLSDAERIDWQLIRHLRNISMKCGCRLSGK